MSKHLSKERRIADWRKAELETALFLRREYGLRIIEKPRLKDIQGVRPFLIKIKRQENKKAA